jgi:hypothetical protein
MYRSCHRRCFRQALARKRPRRRLRRPVPPPDRAAPGSRMRRVARPRQVPAASCPCHPPLARRQLRERSRRHWDRDRRRSRRVRERKRPTTPTRRARTARRASSWTEPGCVATVGSRPIRPWISQRRISGAPCLSRSSSSDPRRSPSSNDPRTSPPSEPPLRYLRATISRTTRRTSRRPLVQRRLVGYTPTLRGWSEPDRPGRSRRSGTRASLRRSVGIVKRRAAWLLPRSSRLDHVVASFPSGRRIISR